MPSHPLVRSVLLAVLVSTAITATATAQPITATPPVGPVQGVVTPAMHEFLGIPYAEPPVGTLRWAPPVARPAWTTPLDASAFGNRCAQVGGPFGEASTNEDCLFLNVYTPHRKSVPERDLRRKRPVMVWIHGGAFQSGSAENYDPTKLVTAGDVVVVTINYRLGHLGFLAHPALSAESPDDISGNYGILDQQLALRWVQDNIAAFGGNPKKVTIFGESAGGISVHTQMASPLAAGTFHRAIAESGAVFTQPTLATAEASGSSIADTLGCSDQTAACLRDVSVEDVLANQPLSLQTASPVIDGVVLPTSLRTAFSTGAFNRVPLIEGSNHDEMRLFVALLFDLQGGPVTEAGYVNAISTLIGIPPGAAGVLAAQYPTANYPSPGLALSALATDAAFACNAFAVDRFVAGRVPVYAYEFADQNAPMTLLPPASFPYGAAHAIELQYLFTLPQAFPQALSPDQETLSDSMVQYWTRFARTGKPSARRSPRWPPWSLTSSPQFLSLQAPSPIVMSEGSFRGDHKCSYWDNVLGN
ncbi:MAG: carboxylesterase family protein [Candidatus Binatia bacterium]